ncbi:hypothetical protein ACIHJG_37395 [Streptomyces sp. NPDC052415]|uniref:hypothetical protein n=1 Tax=Streptomyces sp. NPDC052415 TaxID=3365690 RepID=UPI0037CD3A69
MDHSTIQLAAVHEGGDAWLADCSEHPGLVRSAWDDEHLAPIATGTSWLVAETQLVLGMPALSRIREEHRGPVLADPSSDTAQWLVPPGAAEELADLRAVKVHPAGWSLRCPPTRRSIEGRFWLARPDGSGRLTDPAVLAAAFGPGGGRRLSAKAPA